MQQLGMHSGISDAANERWGRFSYEKGMSAFAGDYGSAWRMRAKGLGSRRRGIFVVVTQPIFLKVATIRVCEPRARYLANLSEKFNSCCRNSEIECGPARCGKSTGLASQSDVAEAVSMADRAAVSGMTCGNVQAIGIVSLFVSMLNRPASSAFQPAMSRTTCDS